MKISAQMEKKYQYKIQKYIFKYKNSTEKKNVYKDKIKMYLNVLRDNNLTLNKNLRYELNTYFPDIIWNYEKSGGRRKKRDKIKLEYAPISNRQLIKLKKKVRGIAANRLSRLARMPSVGPKELASVILKIKYKDQVAIIENLDDMLARHVMENVCELGDKNGASICQYAEENNLLPSNKIISDRLPRKKSLKSQYKTNSSGCVIL